MKKLYFLGMVVMCFCIMFSSCSEKSSKTTTQGGIRIYLADKPAVYDAVNIVVSQVSVHIADQDSESGWIVISDTIQNYDLLELSNGAMVLFADHQLDPAHYTQIRLKVADGCSVVVDGTPYELKIPSGEQSGIKITHQFEIQPGETYELLLDFDAEKSIHQKGNGDYQMQPVIRAVPVATSGSISGIVDPDSINAYAITYPDTIADTHSDTTGYFKLVGLTAGSYTVQIVPDDTTYADTVFSDVAVVAGQTADLGSIQLRKK